MEEVDLIQARLQDNAPLRYVALALLAVGVGAAGGLVIVAGNPLVPFVALAALVALPWLITRPLLDLAAVVVTITLLPFAVLPIRLAVLTPTLLEIGLFLLYASWLLRAIANPGEKLTRTPVDGWMVVFLGCTLFAFLLGLARDHSAEVIHSYFKLVLSVGVFFAAGSIIRNWEQMAAVLKALIISGAATALLGVVLWALPDQTASGLLNRLGIVGYPTGQIIRYVEDNPALGERAIGTQVDPNSFGGLLVIIAAFTGVQLLSRKPLLPKWLLGGMMLVEVAALVLTQSRSALIGLVAAGVLVATMRYRRLWAWGLVGVVVVAALGLGSGYFARLGAGLRFEDQANLMRLAEYSNALNIISRYPVFGVGFGTAGELDLTTGVSSVYLTAAERTGLLGLSVYLAVIIVFFTVTLPAVATSYRHAPKPGSIGEQEWSTLDSALLGGTAAVLGASIVGIADHYYFNIEFPHMVAVFWLAVSITLAAWNLRPKT